MIARELKARKAKYGFDAGTIGLGNIIPHSKLLVGLQVFDKNRYTYEAAGYTPELLKIYTDDDEVAQWIRNFNY